MGIYYINGALSKLNCYALYNGNFYLGNRTTVFQAEVTAIKKSAEMLLNSRYENQSITFYSDSQASLAALHKLTVNSYTV